MAEPLDPKIEAIQQVLDTLHQFCEKFDIGLDALLVFEIDGTQLVEHINTEEVDEDDDLPNPFTQ